MNDTLVLNADARPISFLPISSISWQEAIKALYIGAAEALHVYKDWKVHSPSMTMQVPSVIILKKQVKVTPTIIGTGNPQRHLIFLRDLHQCQYCNEQFQRSQLTIDHVIPKKYGGKTRWDNVTTCCSPCNANRGHNTHIQPRNKPVRPTFGDLMKNIRKFQISMPSIDWNNFLGWEESKIRLVDPRTGKIVNDNVDFGIRLNLTNL